jgi:hypothetical protein
VQLGAGLDSRASGVARHQINKRKPRTIEATVVPSTFWRR